MPSSRLSSPKISVCLPVYNGQNYLSQAIESVLNQSYSDFEFVIRDDASTDESSAIISRYAKQDNRIFASTATKNAGLFENYNSCFGEARGDYLKPFAQDDLLAPSCLERMSQELDSDVAISLVACARKIIDHGGNQILIARLAEEDVVQPGPEALKANLKKFNNNIGEPCAVIFRRQDLGTGFDTRYKLYGDIEYWCRLLSQGKLSYLADPLCSFRRHETSKSFQTLRDLSYVHDMLLLANDYPQYIVSETLDDLSLCRALEQGLQGWARYMECTAQCKYDFEESGVLSRSSTASTGNDLSSPEHSLALAVKLLAHQAKSIRSIRTDLDDQYADAEKSRANLKGRIRELQEQVASLSQDKEQLRREIEDGLAHSEKAAHLEQAIKTMMRSKSWRLTEPARKLKRAISSRFRVT